MEKYKIEEILGDFSKEQYKGDEGTTPYRLFIPKDGGNGKPIVLFMHGAGERGSDNEQQFRAAIDVFVSSNEIVKDAIFILPQCPENEQWVKTPWANGNYSIENIPESWELKNVIKIVDKVATETCADRDRIYVMGLSMGGFATWDLIMRHGEIFAAAMPICGGADPSQAEKIKNIPIRTFHGEVDDTVPVSGTREMVAALKAIGANIAYTEFPGVGHWSWDAACSSEGIGEWMFSQRLSNRK